MAARKQRVTLAMSGPVLRKLDRAAKAMGRSRSACAEDLLSEALQQSEFIVAALANERVRRAFSTAMGAPGVAAALGQALGHELTDLERQQVLGFFKAGSALKGE